MCIRDSYNADVEPIAVPSLIMVPDFIARPMNTFVESLIPNALEIVDVIGKFIAPRMPEEEYISDELPAHATVEIYPEMPQKPRSTASGSAKPRSTEPGSPQPISPGTGDIFPIPGYKPKQIERFQFDQSAIEDRLKKKAGPFFGGLTGFIS